jgi:hypothetical protein
MWSKASMAKRKKAKRASVKKQPRKATVQPPKGYTVKSMSQGDFAQTHDFEAEPVLEGTVESVRRGVKIPGLKKKQDILNIKTKSGELRAVWRSAVLSTLFDDPKTRKGLKVWIRFDGYATKHKKGQNPAKLFTVAIA